MKVYSTSKLNYIPFDSRNEAPQLAQNALIEQLKWLNKTRWLAAIGIISAGIICSYIFPVLESIRPFYVCGILVLILNIIYVWSLTKVMQNAKATVILAMIEIEADLLILTMLLHFSGGVTNPFILFYVFHIILATIILPRTLSFSVGLSTIVMCGFMMVGEMQNWKWLEHKPMLFSSINSLWSNPVYVLGTFVAFVAMIVLAQYLTRTVIARMMAKEMEAARNYDVLQAIINAMTEGMLFITRQQNIAICNTSARTWTDNEGNLNTIDWSSYFPSALREHIEELFKCEDFVETVKTTAFYFGKSPRHYIEARSCPVTGNDGSHLGYVIVGQDLTERKKLEQDLRERTEEVTEINEMLKRSRVEATQREKMVAIGQMAAGIAHEIGNPLASLSSVVQYLERKTTTDEQKEYLGLMGKQVQRISAILKRMLNLSRPVISEHKWTDINLVIDATLSLIRFDKRAKSITINYVNNNQLPMVWLNPQHLEQVFLNIFINALDAIASKKDSEQNSLNVITEYKDDTIEIHTTDTGIGMSNEVCKKAFESFFTTKEIGKGTGLGLFICYNLIKEMDGTINIASEPAKGTSVTIKLPIRPQKYLIDNNSHNIGAHEQKPHSDSPIANNEIVS